MKYQITIFIDDSMLPNAELPNLKINFTIFYNILIFLNVELLVRNLYLRNNDSLLIYIMHIHGRPQNVFREGHDNINYQKLHYNIQHNEYIVFFLLQFLIFNLY